MNNPINSASQFAFRLLLRPIASMALKCGITWKEFSDLSKSTFVQAATDEYGIGGRPTNVSRVSILTGISRKEVRRQRDLSQSEAPPNRGKTTDATRVLSGWHQDPNYLGADAEPQVLPESGSAPSFESLCKHYGGDIPVQTMLKELLHTRAVEKTPDGLLRVMSRFYQPTVHDDETLRWAASLMRDLTETAMHDVFLDDPGAARFCRKTDSAEISSSAIPEFRRFLKERGQTFLEEVDDWLAGHAVSDNTNNTEHARIGVGLFAIEDLSTEEK